MTDKMPKALIISCNDSYDYGTRTRYVEQILKEEGYSVEHLISDFDHRSKKPYKAAHEGIINYVHVPRYTKNISFRRIWSHIHFGQQVKKFVMARNYELVYHCAPPNVTIKKLSQCREKKRFKLITEVGDMWPESIPIGNGLKRMLSLPFSIWSRLRDKYLYNSDAVIAECDLFRDTIKKKTGINQIQTLYFCKEYTGNDRKIIYRLGEPVGLCYLGSVNNIIDIEMISAIIKTISEKASVVFHIIGDGENRQILIDSAKHAGAQVEFHGIVFDESEKQKVFNQCHYALNIMKPEVVVGMTMKSLDYISAGMPIINNIGGDIWKMVEEERNGFNVTKDNVISVVKEILFMTENQYQQMQERVAFTHKLYFNTIGFNEKIKAIIG